MKIVHIWLCSISFHLCAAMAEEPQRMRRLSTPQSAEFFFKYQFYGIDSKRSVWRASRWIMNEVHHPKWVQSKWKITFVLRATQLPTEPATHWTNDSIWWFQLPVHQFCIIPQPKTAIRSKILKIHEKIVRACGFCVWALVCNWFFIDVPTLSSSLFAIFALFH